MSDYNDNDTRTVSSITKTICRILKLGINNNRFLFKYVSSIRLRTVENNRVPKFSKLLISISNNNNGKCTQISRTIRYDFRRGNVCIRFT